MRWFLLFSSLFDVVSTVIPDGVTLLSLKKHWTFEPSFISSTWTPSPSTPCSWAGVRCNNALQVNYLNLTDFGIVGQLGPEIGNCTWLESLDLNSNNLIGQIPYTLKNLRNLKFLSLSHNQFSGEIPYSLTQITPLYLVDLSHNKLSGSIPSSVGNMSELMMLYL
ncbi:hypothetical protein RJT34_08367 [Clitoria ternatea]|uniref:Leucine-rich repeat-containing N-terminal plant-type domain-containing protein n=1 Tax=Clitoria ternatea TaxID=43366 RepID=A0AAN9PUT5_CLITE